MAYLHSRNRTQPGAYHVWNKGLGDIAVFRDDEDRLTFESLFTRHLNEVPILNSRGRPFTNLRDCVRLNARNILTTHYHLILWQRVPGGIEALMRRVGTVYSRYFHKKYGGDGQIFIGEFRARRIDGPQSFKWRVSYVHDNHKRLGVDYRFSTHGLYLRPEEAPSWLDVRSTLNAFGGLEGYLQYMRDRQSRKSLDAAMRLDHPSG